MESSEQQYITDEQGNKVAVILPIKEYEQIKEALEELEDIRLYDETKSEDDGSRISLDDYRNKRKANGCRLRKGN